MRVSTGGVMSGAFALLVTVQGGHLMIKLISAAMVATALMAAPAAATTIDFADYADTYGEQGYANGSVITIDGIDVRLSAGTMTIAGGVVGNTYSAYLDASSGGQRGGLGVCKALDMNNQCMDASDDSIDGDSDPEAVNIAFQGLSFDFEGIEFRDGEHNLINDSMGQLYYAIGFEGGSNTGRVLATFSEVVALFTSGLYDVQWMNFAFVDTEFYVASLNVSDVPVPAALPLLLSGLGGLGFAARRRKQAA